MMLQNQTYQEQLSADELGDLFTPARIYEIAKRRALYFLIPFLFVFAVGSLIALAWPARFVSEGKILVQSQEIPADLVRPTVVSLANARIQIIEQRVMTRDNLLTIAKKFQISQNSWQGLLPGTEIIDFIRARTHIKPLELKLQGERKQAIAFTVGFEYEQPLIATKVANELVTMILSEDARARTNFAAETTKFIERDVQRLEAQLTQLDVQISELKRQPGSTLSASSKLDEGRRLAALKAELLIKSAIYSATHPEIRALKRKIEAFENAGLPLSDLPSDGSGQAPNTASLVATGVTIDSLETKRTSVASELSAARQKLSAARLGESLERGQHSERLEVLEQPTLPTKPTTPNRPKIFAIALAIALMAGGGLAFASEMIDQSVRRSTDLFSIIDSHLIVSVPYIATRAEVQGKKRKIMIVSGVLATLILGLLVAILFVLPPLDIAFAKLMTTLLK